MNTNFKKKSQQEFIYINRSVIGNILISIVINSMSVTNLTHFNMRV